MTDYDMMNTFAKEFAVKCYQDSTPMLLQLKFKCISTTELRGLLAWSNNSTEWVPTEYPANTSEYRLIAACMLRYYYNVFPEGIMWETCDGAEAEFEENTEFVTEKAYWTKIYENDTPTTIKHYPYLEYEDPEELAALDAFHTRRRPRFFSRDFYSSCK
jgi:hypothetical protein